MVSSSAILLLLCSVRLSNAQLLSAYEQAYGPWKIYLSRGLFGDKWYLEQPVRSADVKNRSSKKVKVKNSDLQLLFPPISERIKETTTTKGVKSLTCILNLEKNGKFTICIDDGNCNQSTPQATDTIGENSGPPNNLDTAANTESGFESPYSPLRGEYYLSPNPYCVTDRSYDTLTLIAEPRIRRAHCKEGIITELARIELRCKIWGRYGVGAVRNKLGLKHGREMGRINHGTVLVVREYENESGLGGSKQITKREIIASFTGRGVLDSNTAEGGMSSEEECIDTNDVDADNGAVFDDLEGEF